MEELWEKISRKYAVSSVSKTVSEAVKVFPEVAAVIVFGSLARGDWSPGSDIDILVLVEGGNREEEIVDFFINKLSSEGLLASVIVRKVSDVGGENLLRAILREGLVFYVRPPVTPLPASSLGLKPYSLVKLEMPSDRRKRWRAEKKIYGSKGSGGLLRKFEGEKLAPTLILLPAQKTAEFEEEILKLGVHVKHKIRIYI